MLESLTWQAAFAIVGSVVAIATGIFGYLIKVRNGNKENPAKDAIEDAVQEQKEQSEIREQLIKMEADVKILMQHGKNTNRRLDEHIEQDDKNFGQINHKIDKLTDILMKILTDDKM